MQRCERLGCCTNAPEDVRDARRAIIGLLDRLGRVHYFLPRD
jgi:hypothetical protein